MSQTAPIAPTAAARPDVHAAVARAADATGVDFSYLLAQARIESSLNPAARAPTSSAAGLYQFTSGTWLATLERHGAEHGLGWAQDAIAAGRVANPNLRAQIMALRFDPQVSALMAGELASDNRADLTATLGRTPDAAELYLAHFLGSTGASRFLTALGSDPAQSAAALLPAAAAANRGIFYSGGAARSVGQVMDVLRAKVGKAMGDVPLPAQFAVQDAAPPVATHGPVAAEFHALAAAPAAAEAARGPRVSMAQTLANSFGLAGDAGAVPAHVRAAYGTLQALGL